MAASVVQRVSAVLNKTSVLQKYVSVTFTNSRCSSDNKRTYFTYSPEISQYIPNKEPKWVTAEEAVSCIKSGDTVFVSGAASTPVHLVTAMADHGKECKLKDVTVCHMHTEGRAAYTEPDCKGIFKTLCFFMAKNVRKAVAEGLADSVPIFLSDIPVLFHKDLIKPDVALITVSPPDSHGFCSLGTSVDCVRAGLSKSKIIIAQVNCHMPRTFGEAIIHQSHFDFAVKKDAELPIHESPPLTPDLKALAKHIADNLVEDGATLQMGIGAIPDAVLELLGNHKDLGIHSEMFANGVIPLVEKGVITNNKKTLGKGRIVTSFLIGSQRLYDFVNDNPSVEMRVVDYTNSPFIIAQQPKMTAINSCIEVDLTGQVVSDSVGTRMFSGFGGQVDFISGAGKSLDGKGKPIIAMKSMNPKTKESKIVPFIKEGAGVVTSRAHAHYIVTEHGIADLFGKGLHQRAYHLIQIADPSKREELEKAAFERYKVMPHP